MALVHAYNRSLPLAPAPRAVRRTPRGVAVDFDEALELRAVPAQAGPGGFEAPRFITMTLRLALASRLSSSALTLLPQFARWSEWSWIL